MEPKYFVLLDKNISKEKLSLTINVQLATIAKRPLKQSIIDNYRLVFLCDVTKMSHKERGNEVTLKLCRRISQAQKQKECETRQS